jgi:hypothetical protein
MLLLTLFGVVVGSLVAYRAVRLLRLTLGGEPEYAHTYDLNDLTR